MHDVAAAWWMPQLDHALSHSGESPWKVAVCDAKNLNYPYTMLEDTSNSP